MTTCLSLSLLIELKEMRPNLRRPAIEAIKYFIGGAFAKKTLGLQRAAVPIEFRRISTAISSERGLFT